MKPFPRQRPYIKKNDGYYYKLYSSRKNWQAAHKQCKREGANLAIIWNSKTRSIVRSMMRIGWIGATDRWREGLWKTPTGSVIRYKSWGKGEPNNAGNEDCAVQNEYMKWNDAKCSASNMFLCQRGSGKN